MNNSNIDSLYVGLHRHSMYSMLDAAGKVKEQIIPRLKYLGQNTCSCTDHGNVFGHLSYYHAMREADIKPILGVEAYSVVDMRIKGRETGGKKKQGETRSEFSHLTILASSTEGYQNLLRLVDASYREGFYYVPRTDFQEVVKYQKGLVVLSGCLVGQLSRLCYGGKAEEAYNLAKQLKEQIERFYIEIIPCPSLENSFKACKALWQIAEELRIPQVITDDAHFPSPEDYLAQDTLFTIGQGRTVKDENRYRIPNYHYYCSGEEILERARKVLPHIKQTDLLKAIFCSREIADSCNVELPKSRGPIYPVDPGQTADIQLQKWIAQGRAYRRSLGLLPEEWTPEWDVYLKREEYELDILRYHSFQNYFLLVTDIVRWSTENDFWCIARGSCGGSLLCWYLGITQVDPIKFKLPVERFIDKSRKDMPDIDLDFDARHRDKVFGYLAKKYGERRCALVGAISRFGPRQAIRDVCKSHEIPGDVLDRILILVPDHDVDEGIKAEHVLERFFEENESIKPYLQRYPALRLAAQIEGQVRQSTVHAAGVIVDEEDLDRIVSVAAFPNRVPIAACDKEDAARQGLLKIDVLSVNMLSVIKEMLECLNLDVDWLYRLPLDDAETYKMLASGRNMGVFQLQGDAAGKLMQRVRPRVFNDLLAITCLARPGPLQSGGADEFCSRRHGNSPMPRYHPVIQKIVEETLGIILYQEQVMEAARSVGQFDWPDVHKVRKAVASVRGAVAVEPFHDAYLKGAKNQEIPEEDAEHLWRQCLKSGNYLFNMAHATQYALIGYWSAYLKTHHPALFTCVFAKWQETGAGNKQKKERLRGKLFQEFRSSGGRFRLIDLNQSRENFTVIDEKTILGGFENIVGCGETTARNIVANQPYANWEGFFDKCPKTLRERLQATKIDTGKINMDAALVWAPWFLEITLTEYEMKAFKMLHCVPIKQVIEGGYPEARIIGKVTNIEIINIVAEAKKYGGKVPAPGEPFLRAVVTIADPSGSIDIHFSPRNLETIQKDRNPFRGPHNGIASTLYIVASTSENRNRFYANDAICVREAKVPAAEIVKKQPAVKRLTSEEKSSMDAQLALIME